MRELIKKPSRLRDGSAGVRLVANRPFPEKKQFASL